MSFYLRKCVLILRDEKNYYRINGGGGIDKTKVSTFNDITYEARVSFEISKDKEDIYMSAEFTIYGLEENQIDLNLSEKKTNEIIFYAGYEDTDFDEKGEPIQNPIFVGRVFHMEQSISVDTQLKIYAGVNYKLSDKVPFFSLKSQTGGISYKKIIKELDKKLKEKKIILNYNKIQNDIDNIRGSFSETSYATSPTQDLRDYMNYFCNNLSNTTNNNIKWYIDFSKENINKDDKISAEKNIKYSIILYKGIEKTSNTDYIIIHSNDLISEYDNSREREYREKFYKEKIGTQQETKKDLNSKFQKISSIIRNDISLDRQVQYIKDEIVNKNNKEYYSIKSIKYVGDTHKEDDSWKIILELLNLQKIK